MLPLGDAHPARPNPTWKPSPALQGSPVFQLEKGSGLNRGKEVAAASPVLTQPADLPQNQMNLLEPGRRAFLPGAPRVAPAPAPGPATGLRPARHLPKQLLGQQSPAPPCHQGVETPHWDTGSAPKFLLDSKVEHLRCSSACRDGNASGAKPRAQGWPLSPNQCWPP